MKRSLLSFLIASITFSVALAQVGIKELDRRTIDVYEGDPSVVVKTETNIQDVFKSWRFTQFVGETYSGADKGACSVVVNHIGTKTLVTVTNFSVVSKTDDGPLQTTVEFKSSDKVLESLSRGLEAISAKYDVVYREQGNKLVAVTPEPLLTIGAGEGHIFVEVSDFGHKAECASFAR